MALMTGYGVSGADHDFYAYDADGALTVVEAVEDAAIGGESRYTATMPAGTVRYELRYRGADAAGSYMAWEQTVWASQASVDGIPRYGDAQRWTNTSTSETHDIEVERAS